MNPKLNSTVSVVKINNAILEFFKSNTRRQVRIHVQDDTILKIVCALDGTKDINEISSDFSVDSSELMELISFFQSKGILDTSEPKCDFENYKSFRRIIHFLEDYAESHADLVGFWNKLRQSTVLIVGLGAVGSWVAANLVQSGVVKLILMDADVVDASNLHRQFGYTETDIGKQKIDVLSTRFNDYDGVKIVKDFNFLAENTLEKYNKTSIDLIINCADKPNVDTTSLWIGEYAMRKGIPHIVGGGYNLHLSLIGQTVVPGKSACVKCFQKQLEEENKIDPNRVKKLAVKNRKVGSFGPMCSLIASIIGMEAVKILSGCTPLANTNRRGEFNIYSMDITFKNFERRDDCEWCGINGKYFHKKRH